MPQILNYFKPYQGVKDFICFEISRCKKKLLEGNERFMSDLMSRVKAFALSTAAKMRMDTKSIIYGESNSHYYRIFYK